MAWGYWNAHSLTHAKTGRHASPAPTIHTRSRDQSLERDRREIEQSACPTPSRVSVCTSSTPGPGGRSSSGEIQSPERELGQRTKSERSTLPRGRTSEEGEWIPVRNTLPRGKSDCDTGWGTSRSLSRGKSDSDWGERCTLPRGGKSGSEGEFCPACTSCRVSFQSVKESRGSLTDGGTVGEKSHDSSEILSSSLPTPPPPPFQASFTQPSLSREGGRGGGTEIMETFSLKRNREERRRRQNLRNSCSSHESQSHKSSASHRSSEEENVDSGCRTDSTGRQGKRTSSHTRTPSSERQFGSFSEGCSKEGSSDGNQCRYPCCPSRDKEKRSLPSSLKNKNRPDTSTSVDSKPSKTSSSGSVDQEKREKFVPQGKVNNAVFSDETDSPKEWKTFRDNDSTRWRNVEKISFNGAQIWRERAQVRGRINSGTDSGVSPPRRSLRSLTPDDDSISFHESLGRELTRRRRNRRRSGSCSSQGEEEEEEEDGVKRRSKRLDSANSTHSITGASSRNSSSKSSSRSSRSPSVEFIKQGCSSIQCIRGRKSLR